jgi:hypothetical protein
MFQNSANAIAKGEGYFDGAIAAGEPWYNDARNSYQKSDGLIDQQVDQLNYSKEGNAWYDQYVREQLGQAANLTSTGEIPAAMEEAIMGSMNRMLEQSIGQQMNSMAGSGTINSSVNSSIMNNLANQAANAYQDNYMDTWNSVHQGVLGNAAGGISGGDTFGRTNLNIAAGYGDAAGNSRLLGDSYANTGNMRVNNMLDTGNSFVNAGNAYTNTGNGYVNQGRGYTDLGNGLMTAGSGRINDWLNINKGYNDTSAQNLAEREYLNNAVPQYWQNALGPFSMVPGLLEQMQGDFANTGRRTTVVS